MKKLGVKLSIVLVSCVATLLLFPAAAFAVTYPVAVDETNFPDANWREYVNDNFAGGDYELTQAEIEAVTWLVVFNGEFNNLIGIEYFTETDYLFCESSTVTNLNLTGLPKLVSIEFYDSHFTSVDLTGQNGLVSLFCVQSTFEILDMSGLMTIEDISIGGSTFTTLDLTGLTNLLTLYFAHNSGDSIDLTGAENL